MDVYIKHHTIRSRIYNSLNDLEETICEFIKNLDLSAVKSICSVNYFSSY